MKLRASSEKRKVLSEKLMDWGNLFFVGMSLGQAFTGGKFHWEFAFLGFVGLILAYIVGFFI